MKHFVVIFTALFLFSFNSFAQDSRKTFELEYIKDYRIKLDGGCSFFTYDTNAVENGKYIFIVSKDKRAFINVKGKKDYIYMNFKSFKETSEKFYKITYSGSGFTAIFTAEGEKLFEEKQLMFGTLEIKDKYSSQVFKIHGKIN